MPGRPRAFLLKPVPPRLLAELRTEFIPMSSGNQPYVIPDIPIPILALLAICTACSGRALAGLNSILTFSGLDFDACSKPLPVAFMIAIRSVFVVLPKVLAIYVQRNELLDVVWRALFCGGCNRHFQPRGKTKVQSSEPNAEA